MVRTWMKTLRKEKGVTLAKLGEATGLSVCYLYNIEMGWRKCDGLNAAQIEAFARALGVSPRTVYCREQEWLKEGRA